MEVSKATFLQQQIQVPRLRLAGKNAACQDFVRHSVRARMLYFDENLILSFANLVATRYNVRDCS